MLTDKFIQNLLKNEDNSVTSVMAFMSYNPSIGRVLEKGGVKKFQKLILEMINKLPSVNNCSDFDDLHKEYLQKIIAEIKTNSNSQVSIGQAQKPINVFYKVYIDWARKPDENTRNKLLPFLHVPLDSILMETISTKYPDWYQQNIKQYVNNSQKEFRLSQIKDEELYYCWQKFFREKYPEKPLIFDVAWALNRKQ